MKSTVETLSPTRVRLAVEVPFDDLKPSLDTAYRQLAQNMRVPGFRPGKVPARIIDQRVGRGAVIQEAVNEALPRIYGEAAREHELNVLGQPEITEISDADEMVPGSDWHFTAEVDIRPEVTLPDLDGIAIAVDDAEVTDDAVDEQVDELRERFGTLKTVERPVESGDYVSLDLSTTVGGESIDEGSAKGLSYVVGSGDLVDGLDDAITGSSAGDSATFGTTLQHGDHAGAEGEVTAVVKSVKIKELPELDDEFAQLASEFDTVDELKADLRERLGRVRVMEQGAQARDKLIEHLIETVDFPLPESAVKAEVEYREHDIVHSLNHDESLMERYLEAQGQTREEFDASMREGAEKSVRAQFILDAVAEKSDVQIGDSELTEYIVRQAQRYDMAPQEFANQIVQGGNLPMLVADIRRNKALAGVLESAVVTDASGNTVDLNAIAAADETADDDIDSDIDSDLDSDLEAAESD
ncbi:trigger factor [Jatrophihabitans endophyticus]|uniref:trigger factor n=1 Tax=Jatrophihabitans endophyticus TaxID=1206085 RepID=UPI0019EC7B51|nr:trigger factor [Jatrophihabitans endophyticus]MBE7188148.1 trigger factor [Jatrophihabitans endophyticus]